MGNAARNNEIAPKGKGSHRDPDLRVPIHRSAAPRDDETRGKATYRQNPQPEVNYTGPASTGAQLYNADNRRNRDCQSVARYEPSALRFLNRGDSFIVLRQERAS